MYVYITYVRWKILILKSVVNFVSSNFIYSKNTSIKILLDLFIHLIKKKNVKIIIKQEEFQNSFL